MWWADLEAAVGQRINVEGIVSSVSVVVKDRHLVLPHISVKDLRYIDWGELKRKGFKGVVFDKDNTRTAPYSLAIWPPLRPSIDRCKAVFGHDIAVFSNSAGEKIRVGFVETLVEKRFEACGNFSATAASYFFYVSDLHTAINLFFFYWFQICLSVACFLIGCSFFNRLLLRSRSEEMAEMFDGSTTENSCLDFADKKRGPHNANAKSSQHCQIT